MSGDRLALATQKIRDAIDAGGDFLYEPVGQEGLAALEALVEIAKAAREVEDTLRIHARGVALIGARHKLYRALARLDSEATEEGT